MLSLDAPTEDWLLHWRQGRYIKVPIKVFLQSCIGAVCKHKKGATLDLASFRDIWQH